MEVSRRTTLRLAGAIGLSVFSGCSGLPFVGSRLTLTLLNFDSEPHSLNLEILRTGGREQSESVVLQEEFKLQPPEGSNAAYELQKKDILKSRKYTVRAHLSDDRSIRESYSFSPDCTGDGEPEEELYVEIHERESDEKPYIRFQQNDCSDNS